VPKIRPTFDNRDAEHVYNALDRIADSLERLADVAEGSIEEGFPVYFTPGNVLGEEYDESEESESPEA
jgi:hypothetical protein